MKKMILAVLAAAAATGAFAQETKLINHEQRLVDVDYTHGKIPYVMGVHNIQTMRANREHPEWGDGFGWTYNHAANLAYWNGTLWMHYLSDPEGEHIPSSQTLIQTSTDGYEWSRPMVIFPPYRVPDGYTKEGYTEVAKNLDAIMHQRMGWYVSKKDDRLLALGYYGICMNKHDRPLDGNGIGRVVREIYRDGSFGPIYFIRYNHEWNESNTIYPLYTRSNDRGFVEACNELLADPLMMQQWVEEADRDDPLIPIPNPQLKGFNYYELADGRLVGIYKAGLYTITSDGGRTWTRPAKIENVVTGTAKSWAEKTSDGKYAMVYNPSYFRWPMVVLTSDDGLNWNNMLNVHGDFTYMRYSGYEKSFGPQYLRGIMPGNGVVPDGNMWLAYTVNKEDVWAMRVEVPILGEATRHIDEDLSRYTSLSELKAWNLYSPLWAPVSIAKAPSGANALKLADKDPYDYAKVEHYFPESNKVTVEYSVVPMQNDHGVLNIELQTRENYAATRVTFDPDGMIRVKRSYKLSDVMPYEPGKQYDVKVEADAANSSVVVTVNGKRVATNFYAPVHTLSKVVFRTSEPDRSVNIEIPAYGEWVLDNAGEPVKNAEYYLLNLKTSN